MRRILALCIAAVSVADVAALASVHDNRPPAVVTTGGPRGYADEPASTTPSTAVPSTTSVPSTTVPRAARPVNAAPTEAPVRGVDPATGVNAPGLWLIRPDGSGIVHFPNALDEGGSALIWAPDAKSLYVQRWFTDQQANYTSSLVRQSVDGTATTLPKQPTANIMSVSTNGRYLALQEQTGVDVVDTTTFELVRQVNQFTPAFSGPTALVTTAGRTISRTDVVTGATTSAENPFPPAERIFVGPAGQLAAVLSSGIAWRDAGGTVHTVDVGGDTFSCDANAEVTRVSCEVEHSTADDLVEVNLLTGATRRIVNAGPGTYAPDGRFAYAVATSDALPFRRMIVVEQTDGSTSTILPAARWQGDELRPTTLDWSPDGSSIAILFWSLDYGY